jgi:hypothetical protein
MKRETVPGSCTADETETTRRWQAPFAREFPRWHVWRGVSGHYYARMPRTSPPLVVRASSAEGLWDEVMNAEVSGWPVSSRARMTDHCA